MNRPTIFEVSVSSTQVSEMLAKLSPGERVAEVAALRPKQLAHLFEACADNSAPQLGDLVPSELPTLSEVIHVGKNSLPVFSRFEKRFCRPPPTRGADVLWGYNEQLMRPLTGPGYFVARLAQSGELTVDYRELPPTKPSSWPPIRSNQAGLSRFIYGGSVDVLRKVGQGVLVGRVYKDGSAQDAWFALTRMD